MRQTIVLFFAFVLALSQGIQAQETGMNETVLSVASSLRGDVDGDGKIGIADVTDLIDYLLGNTPENFIITNADVDGDNIINIADITTLVDDILEVSSAQPSLTATPTTLDMGNVPVGTRKSATISLTGVNLTDPITVIIAETYGGEFTVNKTSLPATGGTVIVTYTPEGAHSSSAQLIFKSGTKTARVIVSGKGVQPTITVAPDTLYFDDSTTTKIFTVTGTYLNSNMTVSPGSSWIAVSPTSLPATGGTIAVTVKPTTTVHDQTGYITISCPEAGSKRVVVIYQPSHEASITITPTSCDFGTVDLGKSVTKTFTVKGTNTTGTLKLTLTETIGGQFTVSPTTLPASGGTVRVTFNPTEVGNHAGLFMVTSTNDGVSAKASYTGRCVAPTPTPTLTVSTTTLDFGTVVKGNSKSMTFTITGTNLTDHVTMTLSSSASQYFTFTPTEISNPNGTTTITVTYRPTAVENHTGMITIRCGTLSKTVNLSGTCVEPTITVSPTVLAFGNTPIGYSKRKTFTVMGTDLTGNLTVNTTNKTVYSVSPTTITPEQAANGATVTVTYTPNTASSHAGTVTVSGGGASSKTVTLSGKGIEATPY